MGDTSHSSHYNPRWKMGMEFQDPPPAYTPRQETRMLSSQESISNDEVRVSSRVGGM
jgi:hypothetical protein